MNEWRQAFLGILLALLSSALILGSSMLAIVENRISLALLPIGSETVDEFMPTMVFELPGQPTYTALMTSFFTNTPEPTFPENCPVPAGWIRIDVLPGDTLYSLADAYQITTEELASANCMITDTLEPGWTVVVPNRGPTPTPCVSPPGWIEYRVREGDTLYYLSSVLRLTVPELQEANCMNPNETQIYPGQILFVPFTPPRPTVPPAPTWTPYPTRTNTSTQPAVPTSTSTQTPGGPVASATPTPTPSQTNPVTSTPTTTSTQAPPSPTSTTSRMPPTSTATTPPQPPTSTPTLPPYPYPD